jgi:hypothetical protein
VSNRILKPLLIDEGLPPQVATALRALDWFVLAVRQPGAPPQGGSDEGNCEWCKANGDAVLVTNDYGRKDKEIRVALDKHQTHAIFVPKSLRDGPARDLAKALLLAERYIESYASKELMRRCLRASGNLVKP